VNRGFYTTLGHLKISKLVIPLSAEGFDSNQAKLAKELGISQGQFSRYEQGRAEIGAEILRRNYALLYSIFCACSKSWQSCVLRSLNVSSPFVLRSVQYSPSN